MKIAILLATYNGSNFIKEQIESIRNQTYKDWKVYFSDDCSTDETVSILNEYCNLDSKHFEIISQGKKFGSAKQNFFYLLETVEAEVYMFCDQDDKWKPSKIQDTLDIYKQKSDDHKPVLVHTDLSVVDLNLNLISESFFRFMNLPPNLEPRQYLIINNVTGCTMLINKELAEIVKRNIPKLCINNILMHDSFLALIASYFGEVYFVNKRTMLYRQHGNNSVGAKNVNSLSYIFTKLFSKRESDVLRKYQSMVSEFCKIDIFDSLPKEEKFILKNYSSLFTKNKLNRVYFILKYKILKPTIKRIVWEIINI